MNGIMGANGIASWLDGSTVFVKEWARGVLQKAQAQRLVLFQVKRDADNVPGAPNLVPDEIDTSLTKENTGRNVPFMATHVGVGIERRTVISSTAAQDLILQLEDWKQIEARIWFEFYFGSDDCAWEQGLISEFPEGYGPAGALGTAIPTIAPNTMEFVSNGPPFQAILRNLHKPRMVMDKTALKAVLDPQHGALALTAGINPTDPAVGVRVTVYGYKTAAMANQG